MTACTAECTISIHLIIVPIRRHNKNISVPIDQQVRMVSTTCLAHDDPARIYDYCPSFAAAVLFTVLFFIPTCTHIVQAIRYRTSFSWVLIMAGIWEIGGYASRSYSITKQAESGIYTAQFLLILLAPLWINAFVYMILGRMIHFFLKDDRIYGLRARRVTLMFVLFDITAFVVQLTGGLMSSGSDVPVDTAKLGLNIYTGGVGLQLLFIGIFCLVAFRFRQLLLKQDRAQRYGVSFEPSIPLVTSESGFQQSTEYTNLSNDSNDAVDKLLEGSSINYLSRTWSQATPLFIALSVALSLIIIRNVYRLVEYGMGGVNGNVITKHEWFQYVFDALLMLSAITVLNIQHPGKTLQGERSSFKAEDKARKIQKREAKIAKKEARAMKKMGQEV